MLLPIIVLVRLRTVAHSYAVSFSIKTCFYETNIFYPKNQNSRLHKIINCICSSMKNKRKFLLCLQLFVNSFCKKTRFSYVFETSNAMT